MAAVDRKRVLVADDDAGIRTLLEAVLGEMGAEVVCVPNGAEAIRLLKTESFHLVMTDLHMPLATGMDVAEYVRHHRSATPVLVMSASWTAEEQASAGSIPCDGLMNKPFELPDLLSAVARVLGAGAEGAARAN